MAAGAIRREGAAGTVVRTHSVTLREGARVGRAMEQAWLRAVRPGSRWTDGVPRIPALPCISGAKWSNPSPRRFSR